jgi:quinol monooxygenase YgiN
MIKMVVRVTVAPGKLREFEQFVASATTLIRRVETGSTLVYDFFYLVEDKTKWLVHETYADLDALGRHMDNFSKNIKVPSGVFTIDEMLVAGEVPPHILALMGAAAGTAVKVYPHAFSRL